MTPPALDGLARATQAVVVALVAGPVAIVGLGALLDVRKDVPAILATVATLAGLVAPAIGWRLHQILRSRVADSATPEARGVALRNATLAALSVTETTAILGALAFAVTRQPAPLVAPAMHAILAGALWPTRERFASFAAETRPEGP